MILSRAGCFQEWSSAVSSEFYTSRKYPYPPSPSPKRVREIPRGRGVSEAKTFKGKHEAKLGFPDGLGFQTKKNSVGVGGRVYGFFLGQHNKIWKMF